MGKVNKQKKPKNRKTKKVLVFDEAKRKEFLTGFHKRKLQRKKKAQQELELGLKEERKRLKTEARESYKKMVVSHRGIPELEHLFSNEYEEDNVTVKVTELSTSEIAQRNNWIGENKPVYDQAESSEEETQENEENEDSVPGMELKQTKRKTEKEKLEFKTEKDLKKALKKQATKNVQKSKAFQMKNKIERQKQKKKSFKEKKERIKIRNQKNKNKGKHTR